LIIGATRGIGLGLVKLALSNYPSTTIYATARDPANATDLRTLGASNENRIKIISATTSDQQSVKEAAEEVAKSVSFLDVVIYNAGVMKGVGNVFDVGIEPLQENIETNVYGSYYTAVAFSPFLLKSTFAKKSLVLISSNFASMKLSDALFAHKAAAFGSPNFDPTAMYNISKTTLNRLGKELDYVLRPQGVPVLLLHPGLVKTSMNPFGDIGVEESVTGM